MSETGNREQGTGSREQDAFERALTQALGRVDASLGFADRVMRRVEAPAPKRWTAFRSWASVPMRAWAGGALAAMLVLGVAGGEQLRLRHERELATQQFTVSMQIEERAMEHTRQQLEKAGVPFE